MPDSGHGGGSEEPGRTLLAGPARGADGEVVQAVAVQVAQTRYSGARVSIGVAAVEPGVRAVPK